MSDERPRRRPEVIPLDDPALVVAPELPIGQGEGATGRPSGPGTTPHPPVEVTRTAPKAATGGIRWGAILLSALGLLVSMALALSFAQFVTAAVERQDWIGWTAFSLLAIAAVAFAAIVGRELAGIVSLRRLGKARQALDAALAAADAAAERAALRDILGRLAERPELKWHLATLAEQSQSASDPGDRARLADRIVVRALDGDARRMVAATARRVSVVTALSPMALVTVGWILVENLRLLRSLASLYGGRPGFLATARLGRMVLTHIVASGGVALTDDLLGQFLGQDLMRRLSRRLGESAFNAALTARIGAAAIEVIRPLPYLEAPRVRARDFIGELLRGLRAGAAGATKSERPGGEAPRPGGDAL